MSTTQVIKEKRRGRPPKNLVQPKPIKESVSKEPTQEQLVLYLPNFDENDDNNFDSNIDSDSDSKSESIKKSNIDSETSLKLKKCDSNTDFINENNNKSIKKENLISKLNLNKDKNTSITYLTDKNNLPDDDLIEKNNQNKKTDYKNISTEKLIDELNRRETLIMMLKSKLKEKNLYSENSITLTKDNKKNY